MSNRAEKLGEKLRAEGEKTVAFYEAIRPEQWGLQTYADGQEWTIQQIFMHVTEAERSIPALIASILDGGSGSPEDFDLDRYNESRVRKAEAAEVTPELLLAQFKERRAQTISMVEMLGDDALDTEGRHPFLGWSKVEDMLKLMYMHTQLHQRDIRKLLKEG